MWINIMGENKFIILWDGARYTVNIVCVHNKYEGKIV